MSDFVSNTPLHLFGPQDWFFVMKPRQYLFLVDEKYICQVWSRSVRKSMIFPRPRPSFPTFWPKGLDFRNETMVVFPFWEWKIHGPNLVQIRQSMEETYIHKLIYIHWLLYINIFLEKNRWNMSFHILCRLYLKTCTIIYPLRQKIKKNDLTLVERICLIHHRTAPGSHAINLPYLQPLI